VAHRSPAGGFTDDEAIAVVNFPAAPPNGMHPTADTPLAMYINGAGRRVTPGVGLLHFSKELMRIGGEVSAKTKARRN
jgi:hypothetical protein